VVWDVYGTWWGLRHQVAPGLNFCPLRLPVLDDRHGGYCRPYDHFDANPAYQELYARWFEYGHLLSDIPHPWTPGAERNVVYDRRSIPLWLAFDSCVTVMPTFTHGWKVTSDDATIQRPL